MKICKDALKALIIKLANKHEELGELNALIKCQEFEKAEALKHRI